MMARLGYDEFEGGDPHAAPRPTREPQLREPKAQTDNPEQSPVQSNIQDPHGKVLPIIWGSKPQEGYCIWSHGPYRDPGDQLLKWDAAFAFAFNWADRTHEIVRVWFGDKIQYDGTGEFAVPFPRFSALRRYSGVWEPQIDPRIEELEGTANTPGWPALVYLVVEGLRLRPFGNSPTTCRALISNAFVQTDPDTLHDFTQLTRPTDVPYYPHVYAYDREAREIYGFHTAVDEVGGTFEPVYITRADAATREEIEQNEVTGYPAQAYDWISTPVALWGDDLVIADFQGGGWSNTCVIDPKTGNVLDSVNSGASPGSGYGYADLYATIRFPLSAGGWAHAIAAQTGLNPLGGNDTFLIYKMQAGTLTAYPVLRTTSGSWGQMVAGGSLTDQASFFWIWHDTSGAGTHFKIYKGVIEEDGTWTEEVVHDVNLAADINMTGLFYDAPSDAMVVSYSEFPWSSVVGTATRYNSDWEEEYTVNLPIGARIADPVIHYAAGINDSIKGYAGQGFVFLTNAWSTPNDKLYLLDASLGEIQTLVDLDDAPPAYVTSNGADDVRNDWIFEPNHGGKYFLDWSYTGGVGDTVWWDWPGSQTQVEGTASDLQSLLTDIARRANYNLINDPEIEFHNFSDYGPMGFPIPGVWLDQKEPLRSFAQKIMSYYGVYVAESERKIKFRILPRGANYTADWTLTEDDLIPDNDGVVLRTDVINERDVPREIQAHYYNWHQAMEFGILRQDMQTARQNIYPVPTTSSRRLLTIEAPLIIRPGRARRTANEILTNMWSGRYLHSFSVCPDKIDIEPATIGEITMNDGRVYIVVVEQLTVRSDYCLDIQAASFANEEVEVYADDDDETTIDLGTFVTTNSGVDFVTTDGGLTYVTTTG